MLDRTCRMLLVAILLPLVAGGGCGEDGSGQPDPGPATDQTPPAVVNDLRVQTVDQSIVTVAWTAPGDDGDQGNAAEYDIRYSADPITNATWAGDSVLAAPPTPAAPGTGQTAEIDASGFDTLYVAMKAADEVPNWSAISNVVSVDLSTQPDQTPPAAVNDLHIQTVDQSIVTVAWTAPGDDGDQGNAAEYDIRYSADPITNATWAGDSVLAAPPAPAAPGTGQAAEIDASGFDTLYVAMKAADEVPNWSPISNVVSVDLSTSFVIHQLTTRGNNSEPCLNNGVVTWIRSGPNGDDIYMKDLTNTIGPIRRITADGGEKRTPSNIAAVWVVWAGKEAPSLDWEIYSSSMGESLVPYQITDNRVRDTHPVALAPGCVAWKEGPVMFEVIRYFTGTPLTFTNVSEPVLPVATYSNHEPATDGTNIIWRAYHKQDGDYRFYRWTVGTGLYVNLTDVVGANTATDFSIYDGRIAFESGGAGIMVKYWDGSMVRTIAEGHSPSLHAGRIAYAVWDGDWEIYYWDGDEIHRVTDNSTHDSQPSLYGDLLVWVGHPDGGPGQIFYTRISDLVAR